MFLFATNDENSGQPRWAMNIEFALSRHSDRRLFLDSASSSLPLSYLIGTLYCFASVSTASLNVLSSCSRTAVMMSPPLPHTKQWKTPASSSIEHPGVLDVKSAQNGQNAMARLVPLCLILEPYDSNRSEILAVSLTFRTVSFEILGIALSRRVSSMRTDISADNEFPYG